jgi:hypothetical protein
LKTVQTGTTSVHASPGCTEVQKRSHLQRLDVRTHCSSTPCCRERRNLARTLKDNDDVISTLQTLLGILMHTIALVAYMACFNIDIGHLLITLSSLSLAFAFIFGNSLKTLYESVVFLFVIRPYQVGHYIVYKDANHCVKNFGLLSTQLQRYDGRQIWVRPCSLFHNARQLATSCELEYEVTRISKYLCA